MIKSFWLLVFAVALLAIPSAARAQATVIIGDTAGFSFTASPDQNTTFAGSPVLTAYRADFFDKSNAAGTGTPLVTANLGKPTPDAANVITVPALKPMIQPNVEYIVFISAIGPGAPNGVRNTASVPFGYPGAPRPSGPVTVNP